MPTVTVSGETLHYQIHHGGTRPDGPPLVLVHGAGGNLMHWPGALRRLPGRTVYALDLPGHGKSGGAGGRRSAHMLMWCVASPRRLGWFRSFWPGTRWAARSPWNSPCAIRRGWRG